METQKYWQKQESKKPLYPNLAWNLPEQRQGSISIIGGHSQNFNTAYRTAEYLGGNFSLQAVQLVLPDALQHTLPSMPNLTFTSSTDSGSFARSPELERAAEHADAALIIGDLSRNAATATAVTEVVKHTSTPVILTRDTVDLLTPTASDFIERPDLTIIASAVQLQKLLRALYYPKMIMLSLPLITMLETLHKFTLSYPCTLVTYHAEQIIVAHHGQIITTPLADTPYTPLSLWGGQLAANIAVFQIFNPGDPLAATASAILYQA